MRMKHTREDERSLYLRFFGLGQERPAWPRIDWRVPRTFLCATLATHKPHAHKLFNSAVVIENIPPGYRAYFAVAWEGEDGSVKPLLDKNADSYTEKMYPPVWSGRRKVTFLVGSTANREIIKSIFGFYSFEWMPLF